MRPPQPSRLDRDAVFDDSGHLSEMAIVLLADGQDLLPDEATLHLEDCDECCGKLAESALAAVVVSELLGPPVPQEEPSTAPAAPWSVVGLAFGLALLGLVPTLARLPAVISRAVPALSHLGPILARGLSMAFDGHGSTGLRAEATLASSVLLIFFGFSVARWFRHEGVAS
jgi:hypothetical protein